MSSLEQQGYTRAKIGGFDIDGVLRGKYVSLDKLRSALSKGFGFCDVIFGWDIADVLYDNAQVTGWHTGYPDAHAVLDPTTLRNIPWEPGVAALLGDFRDDERRPAPGLPALAAQAHDRARAKPWATRRVSAPNTSSSSSTRPATRCEKGLSRSRRRSIPACSATAGCARARTPS